MRAGHPTLLSPFRGQETSHIAHIDIQQNRTVIAHRIRFTFYHPLLPEDFTNLPRVLLRCSHEIT